MRGPLSLQRYPMRGKDKAAFLSSLLLPLGLFVSLRPRLNQFWVGSHARHPEKYDSTQMSKASISCCYRRIKAERWEDRLQDGWRRRRGKSSEMKIRRRDSRFRDKGGNMRRQCDRRKREASVFWCLTLPEGRLQFSRAVSTRFLSDENILKILRGHKNTPWWVIPENDTFSLSILHFN